MSSFFSALPHNRWRSSASPELTALIENSWVLTTSLAMIACYLLDIPNVGVFLLIAVVHTVFTGGWKRGLASASLATAYSAIFLSLPGQMFHYAEHDSRRLISISAACFLSVFLIVYFRRRDASAILSDANLIQKAHVEEESELLFRKIADAAPVLLWISDAEGKRGFFNRPWSDFTGLPAESLHGDQWQERIHPDNRSAVVLRYAAAIKSYERFEAEYQFLHSDGQYRWMQDFGVPRSAPDGRFLGYIGSCVDRTERKRVEGALHQLSGRLLELQDDERRRISRELHDTTAQNLAVLSMNLCVVKEAAKVLGPTAQQAVTESLALTEQCTQELRTVSYLLHPPLLDELGLLSALRSYSTGFRQRTGIDVDLKVGKIGRLPRDVELTVFRIAQEALTNVHRHSGSPTAEVRVLRDPGQVRLQVSDQGKGIQSESLALIGEGACLGVGVAGMRERAGQLGGHLKVASSERGTTITAILPLREGEPWL